jgi:hypothetical protein
MERILRITGYKVENFEELQELVPAAFSGEHNRSKVYSFVNTIDILRDLQKLGWNMTYAVQGGSSQFSRHVVRLTNPDLGYMPLKNDNVRPQLIFDNSHNGGSSAQLHMGLFRLVCQSEMVIAIPNLFTGVKFRHMGMDFEELKSVLAKMADQYKIVASHIAKMQDIILTTEQRKEFALKGLAYRNANRFINSDGTLNLKNLNEAVDSSDLLSPMRGGDEPISLWDVFQTVREWLIKGGFQQRSAKGRLSRSKAIRNVVRQISLNKTLWILAEEYLNNPIATDVFDKLIRAANTSNTSFRTYTTAKGEEKKVMIVADLGNGHSQVKDIDANRIFVVATEKLV